MEKLSILDEKLVTFNLQSTLFRKLPVVVTKYATVPYIGNDLKTQASLAQTCRRFRSFFQPTLTHALLLSYIVHGEQEKAKKMIELNPRLLMMHGSAKDYSGNTIKDVTPFELAFGADDIEMCQMMMPYLDSLPGGRRGVLKQIQLRFPKSEEEFYDFSPLNAAITNNNAEAALKKFREDFKPRVIKKGKHFNPKLLLAAIDQYSLGDSYSFWRLVIGYLQRMLPACYAQAFCQCLDKIASDNQPLKRSLKLDDGHSFFPIDLSSHSGLGFDFGIYNAQHASGIVMNPYPQYIYIMRVPFKQVIDKTISGFVELMQQLEKPNSPCLIL